MPKRKEDTGKPRGRITAYAYFVKTCREEIARVQQNSGVVFIEFSRHCAARWKEMTKEERQPFQQFAEQDKLRWNQEIQAYRLNNPQPSTLTATGKKKRKNVRLPGQPMRALSAFFWYCNDERSVVRAAHPEAKVTEVSKILGGQWAVLDPEKKQMYLKMSEKDKLRYAEEMRVWRENKLNPAETLELSKSGGNEEEAEQEDLQATQLCY